ncbi:MAG: HIT family protein, partial [Campylobacteraceae bacterium]
THIDNIENLDEKTWIQISLHVKSGVRMLKEGFGATGVNIGMNLGDDAGAGIGEHVHYHLIPRWTKDTNFFTTVGEIRVIPSDFEKIYARLLNLSPKYFKLSI